MLQRKVNLLAQGSLLIFARDFNVNSPKFAKRWVGPTFRELLHRRKKFKTDISTARNTFAEWNYHAEVFAFGKRLNENFDIKQLKVAFTDISYINQEEYRQKTLEVDSPINMECNKSLIEVGEKCISDYVQSYLQHSLPKCPQEEIIKIFNWLTSEKVLANISLHIGTKDLILCANNSPTEEILRNTFVAVVGALKEPSEDKVYNFIRDFVCTQLNQKDITEIWDFDNALEKLEIICKEIGLGKPEPRLLGQNAPKTILALNYVGVYENKKMLGKGFGESVDVAIQTASIDAICKLYGIKHNQKLFNFAIQ